LYENLPFWYSIVIDIFIFGGVIMPSLLTHYLCGNEMLKVLQNEDLINIITKYRQIFNIGTQGPDIFFYYRVWPWLDSKGINKLGERMHVEKVNDFFINAVEYIKSILYKKRLDNYPFYC
jgi:hypothetical protein